MTHEVIQVSRVNDVPHDFAQRFGMFKEPEKQNEMKWGSANETLHLRRIPLRSISISEL